MSPSWTSPPTVPVTATVPPASAALRTLSGVMALSVMLGRGRGVDAVELVVRRRRRVARRVGGGDAGRDGGVGIGREVAAEDIDAEGAAGDRAGIGHAVDRQGDGVAVLDVAADRAGHRHGGGGLGRIEDVVGGDGVERDARRHGGVDSVGLVVGRAGGIARRVGGGDAGRHGGVGIGQEVAAEDIDAERCRRPGRYRPRCSPSG